MYLPITYRYTSINKQLNLQNSPQSTFYPKLPHTTSIQYPFPNDEVLREHYRNPYGHVRIGRILEDLDSLAGYIAYQHCDDDDPSTRPPLLVTVGVEKITLHNHKLTLTKDMVAAGRVVWTGKSSLDISIEITQDGVNQMEALFTFVARDQETGKAHPINPLKPETTEDREVFCVRQRNYDARKAALDKNKSTAKGAPTPEEQIKVDKLMTEALIYYDLPALADPSTILSSSTRRENTITAQPQARNIHSRIFGGYLMRQAFQLAHSTAYLFGGSRPWCELIDNIVFRKPVNIGDLLRFKSVVLHSAQVNSTIGGTGDTNAKDRKGILHVQVETIVTNAEKLTSSVTNTFNFRFAYGLKEGRQPRRVIPSSSEEALQIVRLCSDLM
jgi:acyl-coenzyme A thioesterase 9